MDTTIVFGLYLLEIRGRVDTAGTAMGTADVDDPAQTGSDGFAEAQKRAIERVGRGPVKGRVVKGRPIEEWIYSGLRVGRW